jgi:hypothetical protein
MVEDLLSESGQSKYEFNIWLLKEDKIVKGVSAEELDRYHGKRTFWHIETIGQAILARAADPEDRPNDKMPTTTCEMKKNMSEQHI